MKEEMEKLLHEEKNSFLQISCDVIEQELKQGKIEGSFTLESVSGKAIKGKVLVADPRVEVQATGFQSEVVKISYYFDGSHMEPEEEVSGSFVMITNFGEYEVPYTYYEINIIDFLNSETEK